jgi:hypothetical protein
VSLPLLPMAAGWGVVAWEGPKPLAGPIPSKSAPGWLPGLDAPAISPEARRWSADYRARLAAADWREEIRPQILARARGRCERCECRPEVLEVHHRHYGSLWNERPEDLEALCPPCHEWADEERRAHVERLAAVALEMAQFRGFCFRVFGDAPPPADAWEQFDRWLDRKEEAEPWEL